MFLECVMNIFFVMNILIGKNIAMQQGNALML